MTRGLLSTGLLLAALASADPISITFSGTGSGSVGGTSYNSAAFTFTFESDTNLITTPACCATVFTMPGGTPATFWIAGIGSGTFMGDQAVFANPSPNELAVGIWHYNMPDWLDLSSSAFANYDLSTSLGPVASPVAYAFRDSFPSSLGTLTLSSASGVTYTAVVGSRTGASVSISAVVNGASFLPRIASSTWITIFGTNLSQTMRQWTNSDFADESLPTQLDGVSAKVNGNPAYIYYVSPTQLNVLVPDDTNAGQVQVQVTTVQGTSNSFAADKRQVAPAFFLFQGTNYVAATHPDGTYVGKPGLITGSRFAPAKPGDIISLWGTGFGPTNPSLPAAKLVTNAASLANPVIIMIGGQQAKVSFAGRSGSGLDQFNVTVPATLGDGDRTLVASIGGLQTQAGIFITVQKENISNVESASFVNRVVGVHKPVVWPPCKSQFAGRLTSAEAGGAG